MGSVISCGLKLVLQIFNTVLFVAFLAVAVFGIVLKTSKGLVQSILEKAFDKNNVTDEQLKAFAQFITDNSGGVAAVLIVVGLVLAALCLIGCIASCCGCEILLKIYAAILVVLLVVQIIAVAVVFSDPNRLSNWTINAMSQLLQLYDDQSTDKGQMATAIWNMVMKNNANFLLIFHVLLHTFPSLFSMGCVISCGLKLVLQIFNTVLCVAFLAVSLFGVILKTSKGSVDKILRAILKNQNIGDDQYEELATFVTENADGLAIILIVVGLALAALCLIGCIASCCGCNILLKIYAIILIILLVAQIVVVAVLFSNPKQLGNMLAKSMKAILPSYGTDDEQGKMSTTVWNLLMGQKEPFCCGIDGYMDFTSTTELPSQCCNGKSQPCDKNQAKQDKVVGCSQKIFDFAAANSKGIMYVSIAAILLQVSAKSILCTANKYMGCVISCGLKLILQLLNTVLCVAFLAVAVFGILLKSSKSVVQQLLVRIFDRFNIGDEDLRQMAKFITENADGIAIVLIVVGLALAALCLIGCIASCCGCNILLKIYAIILIILLVVQIIAVAVAFSDPARLTAALVNSLEKLLQFYNEAGDKGQTSTTIWKVLMSFDTICCGMDGYGDFDKLGKPIPPQCCNMTSSNCDATAAQAAAVPGCRDKLVTFMASNLQVILYIFIGAILLQAALIVVVMLTICL
ncbi:unnamed protein product [Taenia asiatica]|uniref:Tetraspanin n=1 Tax=Taenia asiatica TaxID=60517 RepID=A0A0R3VTD7_TAEAS|nr:unnamed protein product [Taenia asiatica]